LPIPADPARAAETQAPVRKRRGLPLLPTLMVAIAVPTMLGFGVWQMFVRLPWKEAKLEALAANSSAQLLDIGSERIPDKAEFRLALLTLNCPGGPSDQRAGRNLQGETGYSHLTSCRHRDQTVRLDAGWTARPDAVPLAGFSGSVEGRLVRGPEGLWILVASDAAAPLVPSAPPGVETISNNHFSYAIQWFSFAAILSVIYGLWLRRWRRAS
jgi:surfeit locus 1 family protein